MRVSRSLSKENERLRSMIEWLAEAAGAPELMVQRSSSAHMQDLFAGDG